MLLYYQTKSNKPQSRDQILLFSQAVTFNVSISLVLIFSKRKSLIGLGLLLVHVHITMNSFNAEKIG